MPSIKDLKSRISSVKNTQQTTKAMKMVSAAKLRRATEAILSQRPYAKEIARMMATLSGGQVNEGDSALTKAPTSLLVVVSSDRGLCGGYNGSVTRAALSFLSEKKREGRAVRVVFVGKKAMELVKARTSVDQTHFEEFGAKVTFRKAADLSRTILPLFESGAVDEVVFIYNEFKNAISQVVKTEQVLPITVSEQTGIDSVKADLSIFEPSRPELYEALSAKYFVIQVFKSLLEAQASEHGARMSAMENATKNAGDMIRKLTLQYNKQRQAAITKELLEIISGSEAQKVQA
ncbi:MAG: ATP synthase F1 subunit gamma [Bdellovibrionales bacterium]|nr:ATP synthase F1 subunit gamma [Bdellovibrionales bacterium]